jgi:hypothetical protein
VVPGVSKRVTLRELAEANSLNIPTSSTYGSSRLTTLVALIGTQFRSFELPVTTKTLRT